MAIGASACISLSLKMEVTVAHRPSLLRRNHVPYGFNNTIAMGSGTCYDCCIESNTGNERVSSNGKNQYQTGCFKGC